jgi:mannose-6-phosphate isomerase-like protein (cupin superfamily)
MALQTRHRDDRWELWKTRSRYSASADPARGGEWVHISSGERFKIRTSAADSGGTYVMLELVADIQHGTRMHVHENEGEHFIVLEGTLLIANGDKTFNAPAGMALTVARHSSCVVQSVGYSPPNARHLFARAHRGIVQGSRVSTKRRCCGHSRQIWLPLRWPPVIGEHSRLRSFPLLSSPARGLIALSSPIGANPLGHLNRTYRDLVPAFPQRSPPWYLAIAVCGGLRSAHDC